MKTPLSDLEIQVKTFIRENLLVDAEQDLRDDESLLASGAINSTGILELIAHLESTFEVTFDDNELVGENFETIQKIAEILSTKLPQA